MTRVVKLPPSLGLRPDGTLPGGWWHEVDASQEGSQEDRIVCDLCPRECVLKPDDRGFCFVRQNRGGEMVLTTYGRSTGFCIDPIEKKPLNHFYPGTSVLSFGTAGCNLGCKFCQNWDISKSREVERLSEQATPEAIAEAARQHGCASVAYTYNDPVIWAEYAIDTAAACRDRGIKSVAVTAGYITPAARPAFFHAMDAANVDLKAFTEEFYYKITYSHLEPVLDTLQWLHTESDVWFEITNLVIPQANDAMSDIARMCDWILERIGDQVPLHFTAFHPDFRMRDRGHTPHQTLLEAREIAQRRGLQFVYVGNVDDTKHQSTYCPACLELLIERNWYELGRYNISDNKCMFCQSPIAGRFGQKPGDWGRKRQPVRISDFAGSSALVQLSTKGKPMSEQTYVPPKPIRQRPELTEQQQQAVHRAASEIVVAAIHRREVQLSDPNIGGVANTGVMGAFVTLKRQDRLRGCCGMLGKPMPLLTALEHAAIRTANEDVRLPPISPTEVRYLDLDVTLLFNFQPVEATGADRAAAVEVGRHGLQIRYGQNAGLLLPSVAVERQWDAQTLLEQVCIKAGLPVITWQHEDAHLTTFEGLSVEGSFNPDVLGDGDETRKPKFSLEEVRQLADGCRVNVIALAQGATPNYYLPGCSDGTVSGLAVRVGVGDDSVSYSKMSVRPGLPLQSTLFELSQGAANWVRQRETPLGQLGTLQFDLAVLDDPAMHGTIAQPDLRGFDPTRRMLIANQSNQGAWLFHPSKTAEQQLELINETITFAAPAAANLISEQVVATTDQLQVISTPRPQAGPAVRPPGVAGSFYPADAGELSALVDDLLASSKRKPATQAAIMVPHAGLRYSGEVAAAVFNRVKFPKTIIVIGPKHTTHGVAWSVAPHETWDLPTGKLASDTQLAARLADLIPSLQLDAAAHLKEHGIEVELPFIQRLAPTSSVIGIALGGGSYEQCVEFADGMVDVIKSIDEPPLLVISSDMNHFASDEENRRLDEIALSALETLDPAHALGTIRQKNISMCGVVPAVCVMETLRRMKKLKRCKRVAYATSADVTGDKSRVVGYAGMLFA